MSERGKSHSYYDRAKRTYAYYQKYGFFGTIETLWNWLLSKPERLTALSTFAILLATTVGIGVAIATYKILNGQLGEMRAEQRAWLAPKNITTLPDFIMHPNPPYKKSLVDFSFMNTGKEPARYVNRVIGYRFLDNAWDKDQISKKINEILGGKSCEELSIDPRGPTVFPNDTEHELFQLSEDDARITLGGGHWLLLGGCLVYETKKETHWSDVCRILDPIDPNLFPGRTGFNTIICSIRNQAD